MEQIQMPGEYKVNRPIEIKCTECGVISIPTFQMEKNEHGNFVYSDGCLDLCDECMKKGWTSDSSEIIDALNKDPMFQVGYVSPIQQIDLLE